MEYLIIGASIAGISAAKAIKELEPRADIMIISREGRRPYYRPLIPYLIEEERDIYFHEDDIRNIKDFIVEGNVTGIDIRMKSVFLESGERIDFKKLLIATGSAPVIPDIPGIRSHGVFTMRTMKDALSIKEYSQGKRRAVIIGGGFVGIKTGIALMRRGIEVTIIEVMDRILKGRLDEEGSRIISSLLEGGGMKIIAGEAIEEVMVNNGVVTGIRTVSGREFRADMVVVAMGSSPSIEPFRESGIRIGKGIVVDENLRAGVEYIYAAGDVVQSNDIITGVEGVSGLWTNAREMGSIAGRNMSGENIRYEGFISVMNATEILGLPVITAGVIEDDGYEVYRERKDNIYRKLIFHNDRLIGAIFIGDTDYAGIYTNLIKNKIPVNRVKDRLLKGKGGYINFMGIRNA